jgi:hypothetical protein
MAVEHYPKQRSDVNVGVSDGETVVLYRWQELIYQLNHTATFIWEQCDGSLP